MPPTLPTELPLKSNPRTPDTAILQIDNSSLELFTTCPRAAYYQLISKRDRRDRGSALAFGTAAHTALAHYYRDDSLSHQWSDNLFEEACALAVKELRNLPIVEGEHRTPDALVGLMRAYRKAYPRETWTILDDIFGQRFVEQPFAVTLGTIDLPAPLYNKYTSVIVEWTGRIDLVVREPGPDGRTLVVDHKTTSMFGPKWFDEFKNSSQMTGYAWAVQRLLEQPVYGVLINALICRRPTKTGTQFECGRQIIAIPQWRIAEWQSDTLAVVADFLAHCHRNYFPMHTKWCVGKYGHCPFFDVCTVEPSARPATLMSSMFQPATWSPLN